MLAFFPRLLPRPATTGFKSLAIHTNSLVDLNFDSASTGAPNPRNNSRKGQDFLTFLITNGSIHSLAPSGTGSMLNVEMRE